MDLARELKKRLSFELPPTYVALSKAGMLRYGSDPEQWKKTWRKLAITEPPALLAADFEWVTPETIIYDEKNLGR